MGSADYWARKYREEGCIWGRNPTRGAKVFADFLSLRGAKRVLEVGCGYGRDSRYLAERGFKVTGVDASEEAVSLARSTWGDAVLLLQGAAEALGFREESFEALWSANLLHLFRREGRGRILGELRRVLVRKGVLGLSTASANDPNYGEGEEIGNRTFLVKGKVMHFFTRGEVLEAMEGFKIMKLREIRERERHTSGAAHEHVSWLAVGEKA